MQKIVAVAVLTLAACVLTTRMVRAEGPGPCPTDSVPSGTVCVDKYEASVWETTNAKLVAKIRAGTATLIDLISAGAQQRGVLGDDYGPECPATGNGCTNVYAVSIAGVVPSRFLTWFQAVAAARNSGKRLAASAEWQAAALGTPDPGTGRWLDGLQRAESAGACHNGLAQWMRLRRERLRHGRKPLGMGCGLGTPRDGLRAFRVSFDVRFQLHRRGGHDCRSRSVASGRRGGWAVGRRLRDD
jgi:hypothetical protein